MSTPFTLLTGQGNIYLLCVRRRAVSPQKMVQQILALKPEQQLQVFTMLQDALIKRGLLDNTAVTDDNNPSEADAMF